MQEAEDTAATRPSVTLGKGKEEPKAGESVNAAPFSSFETS